MKIGTQIRTHRTRLHLSQEDLADQVHVSRQTVSNWETERTCPDLVSLLLLQEVFGISLDELVKGDIQVMEEEIRESEIRKLNRYGQILAFCLIASVLLVVPMMNWLGLPGLIPVFAIWAVGMYAAVQAEKVKKDNRIATYKEIVAFTQGRRLDQRQSLVESGKIPYQTVLKFVLSVLITAGILAGMTWIFS